MATFTYTADFGYQKTTAPRVRRVAFGDGYEQRLAFGLNTQPQTYDLVFSYRSNEDADAIEAFLAARGGVESFDWTPPQGGAAIKVVCDQWDRSPVNAGYNTLRAQFRQVFEP